MKQYPREFDFPDTSYFSVGLRRSLGEEILPWDELSLKQKKRVRKEFGDAAESFANLNCVYEKLVNTLDSGFQEIAAAWEDAGKAFEATYKPCPLPIYPYQGLKEIMERNLKNGRDIWGNSQ